MAGYEENKRDSRHHGSSGNGPPGAGPGSAHFNPSTREGRKEGRQVKGSLSHTAKLKTTSAT